jgi:hypothetical protein
LNQHVFWVDTEAVCSRLASMYRDERFVSTVPGQTFWMEGNRLVKVEESAPFIGVAPRAAWPSRARTQTRDTVRDYTPAVDRRDLREGDAERLRERLSQLAGALVGGILFRSLHSMLASEAAGRRLTFALVLRHGSQGAAMVFEYDASACAFVPAVAGDPRRVYLGGFECWATDLLGVLDGEIGPLALMFGRARLWNAQPQRFLFDLLEGLSRVCHPLSRPNEYLRMYERQWNKSSAIVPVFRSQ